VYQGIQYITNRNKKCKKFNRFNFTNKIFSRKEIKQRNDTLRANASISGTKINSKSNYLTAELHIANVPEGQTGE
jgi:hypothetical protein